MTVKSIKDLPSVPGWVTFGEAAKMLNVSGERVRQMAQEGKLETAHQIGRRPIGIVKESEILDIVRSREAAEGAAEARDEQVPGEDAGSRAG